MLTCRQIDRPIRPMFPKNFRNETQIIALVLSADKDNDPDVIGINGAGAALALSDIPFGGPIGAVRIGQVNGEFVVNPTYAERIESKLNITVVATKDGVVMIESGATGVSEETVVDAIEFAHTEIKKITAAIDELVAKAGKTKRTVPTVEFDEAYLAALQAKANDRLKDALDTKTHPKAESYALVKQLKDELVKELPEGDADAKKKFSKYFEVMRERIFREQVTKDRIRPDRRSFDQIRDISIEGRCIAPRPRLRVVYPRRNPGAGFGDPGNLGRRAAPGNLPGRAAQAFHAALQLPAVLRRRNRPHDGHRTPRDRSRRSGRARHRCGVTRRRRIALYPARRFRHPGIERLFLHGQRLRRQSGSHAGRHFPQGGGCRGSHGAW